MRFSSIGDIVLTSPIVRCLKLQLDIEVHFLTKTFMAQIVEHNPYISKIYTIDKKVSERITELKAEKYDYVIDLHKNIRSKRLIRQLGCPSTTFDKLNIEKWLLVNFKINRLPDKHIVDRYFEGVASLGIQNDQEGLDHFIAQGDDEYGRSFQQSNGLYTTIVLGANYYTKRIPVERIQSIIEAAPEKLFVLIGGKDVQDEGASLAKFNKVINTCGQLSLGQSAGVIKYADHVISGDTGMMHVAAAYKKDITSIWGNTVPEFGMSPYFGKHKTNSKILEVKGLSCRPCSKLGYGKCPKGHFKCMK